MTWDEYVEECLRRNPTTGQLIAYARWLTAKALELRPTLYRIEDELAEEMRPVDWAQWAPRAVGFVKPGTAGEKDYIVMRVEVDATEEDVVSAFRNVRTFTRARPRGRRKPPKDGWAFRLRVYDAVQRLGGYARATAALRVPRSTVKSAYQAACRDIGVPTTLPVRAPAPPSRTDLERHLRECRKCQPARFYFCPRMQALLRAISPDTPPQYVTIGAHPEAPPKPNTSKKPRSS